MSRRLLPTFGSGIDKKDGSCSPTSLAWLSFPGGASQTHSIIMGGNIQSIPEQIQLTVKRGMDTAVSQLFGNDIRLSEHVYYVVGFLNAAGLKEKDRRSSKHDIGRCIEKACSNYLSADSAGLEALREKLPTGLVDRRIANGGLKYPNEEFYGIFAVVEHAYATVVTPDNFMYRGGLLLAEIRDALGNDPSLIDQFTILFGREHAFSRDTIETAYKYFIKVFCNLRAKDVALKYNSNLNASNTVGLRQTLAGGITIGKSKQKSKRKTTNTGASKYANLRVAELKKLCRERGLITGGLKAQSSSEIKLGALETLAFCCTSSR